MATPRRLEFRSLADVASEVDRLALVGYQSAGKWNLAQVCLHLRDWLTFPIDGFPKAPFPVNLLMPLLKATMGQKELRRIFTTGAMKPGSPTMPVTVHRTESEEKAAIAALKNAIDKFSSHRGEYLPSPLFGQLSRDEALKLQLIHCAHHLGFLIPERK